MIPRKPSEIIAMDVEQQEALLRRAAQAGVAAEDVDTIRAVFESYAYVSELIDHKNISLARLRQLLFGARTEKTADIVGRNPTATGAGDAPLTNEATVPAEPVRDAPPETSPQTGPQRSKGHGRNGAEAYRGARKVRVPYESLRPGDRCPDCWRGTVYAVNTPGVLIRFTGQPPIQATVYELEKLRCQLCGQVFTAPAPEGVGPEKYDATAASMIGLLKYGSGLPFNRLQGLQGTLEVPLAASTQWEIVEAAAAQLRPAFDELIRQAAQGEVLFNDDTTVKILERMGARAKQRALQAAEQDGNGQQDSPSRTGLFTSGVVATREGRRVALFFSGHQHAGENLRDVLRQRAADRLPPIQMCDALSRNYPAEFRTIVAHCLAHARRQFVEVHERFPDECRFVLESLEAVYRIDAQAREQQLTKDERLQLHQTESGPTMAQLRDWCRRQIEEQRVEPNSALGAAIGYLRKHWDKLTLFLRVAGAPLDNNITERALKKAILHRKNALFYKTQHGAAVGDLYMSLIHTCELCDANPFDYLTQLQRHANQVAATPADWLPWNYRAALIE
jgi:transposase